MVVLQARNVLRAQWGIMRIRVAGWLTFVLATHLFLSGAQAQVRWNFHDAGQPREFELALDQVAVSTPTARRVISAAPSATSSAELKARVRSTAAATGEEIELVVYELVDGKRKGGPRIVTAEVLVEVEPGVDAKTILRNAGATRADPAGAGLENHWIARAVDSAGALDLAAALRATPGVVSASPLLARQQQKRFFPNDPYATNQWHLRNTGQSNGVAGMDVRVTNVWANNIRGTNIFIAIIDDGVQLNHPDLVANINTNLDWDFNSNDNNPSPGTGDDHGTACAGVAAARGNNAVGVSGAAPEATLVAYRLISLPASDAQEAAALLTNNATIQIKSNSWGPNDDGATLEGPGTLAAAALSNACASGRGGRGTIFFWAGGNGLDALDDSNKDGYANSIYTIAIGAAANTGIQSWYSEAGANLVACAPSSGDNLSGVDIGIWTTDRTGASGYNSGSTAGEPPDANYTATFGGTSSATPLAAGVGALILQANPLLGWRDVQELLIRTATRNHPTDPGWRTNGAGFVFNHKYGAGLVNASNAVARALTWTNLGPQIFISSNNTTVSAIPDNSAAGVTRSFSFTNTLRVEHAVVRLSATHPFRGNLRVELISPSAMTSVLAIVHNDSGDHYSSWPFMSVQHWGEAAAGAWTVRVADRTASNTGTLTAVSLTLYGTGPAVSNQPPVLLPVGDKSVMVSNTLAFGVVATDAVDGDAITLTASNLPSGALFGATNGVGAFFWTNAAPTGSYSVTFFAGDKDGTNSETIAITVFEAAPPATGCTMIISEYIEGSSNNKALELFNPGPGSVNLAASGITLQHYNNGSSSPTYTLGLTGTVAAGGTFVIVNSAASAGLAAYADLLTSSSVMNFNGDDAIVLRSGGPSGAVLDSIGQVGVDPGTEWGSGLTSTADNTIRRKYTVTQGRTNITAAFDPATEWDGFAVDTFTGLGTHANACGSAPSKTPPVLNPIGPKYVVLSNALSFTVTADPTDGDPVTLTASNLPAGATFSSTNENGTFSWPVAAPVGVYTTRFFAADVDGAVSEAVVIEVSAASAGLESFTLLNAPAGSYGSGSYVGDGGRTWFYDGARITNNAIDGRAILFATGGLRRVYSQPITGGVASLSLKYLKGFTATGTRSLDVFVNSTLVGQVPDANNTTPMTTNFTGIDISGVVTIRVVSTGSRQVIVDTLSWTPFGAPPADSDGDGIDDVWELQFFPSLTNVNAASDWDGDGFLDLDEFRANTVPTNAASLLIFNSTAPAPAGTGVVIRWQSASNRFYNVARSTNLLAGFAALATNLPATPPENVYTDPAPPAAHGLYRIDL